MSSEFNSIRIGQHILETFCDKIVVWATNHEISSETIEKWIKSTDLPKTKYRWYTALPDESTFYVPEPFDINSPEIQELVAKYEEMLVNGDGSEDWPNDYPDLDVVLSTEKFVVLSLLDYVNEE